MTSQEREKIMSEHEFGCPGPGTWAEPTLSKVSGLALSAETDQDYAHPTSNPELTGVYPREQVARMTGQLATRGAQASEAAAA
jgi:hypothetical protein